MKVKREQIRIPHFSGFAPHFTNFNPQFWSIEVGLKLFSIYTLEMLARAFWKQSSLMICFGVYYMSG